jgi:hypothetical protein
VPIAGNGPIVFPKAKQEVQEDFQSPDSPFLPPVAPPYGDDEAERPRTAPSSGWSIHENSRTVSGPSAPPAPKPKPPFRLPDKGPQYRLSDKVYQPTHPHTQPSLASHLAVNTSKAPAEISRQRAVSIGSVESARGRAFIDILDAQAGINPTNFHDRLRAAGARDYGEDVADRNVGANGSFLDHPATGFAKSTTDLSASHTRAIADEPQGRPNNRHSAGSSCRSRSFTAESSRFNNFSYYAEAPAPAVNRSRESSRRRDRANTSESIKDDRRKSMPSYMNPYPDEGRMEIPEVPLLPWEREGTDQDWSDYKFRDQRRNKEIRTLFNRAASVKSTKQRPRSNSLKAPSNRLSSHSMGAPAAMMFNDQKANHARHDSSASDSPDIHQFNFGDLSLMGQQPPSKRKDSRDGYVGDWNHSRSLLLASGRSFRRFDMEDAIPERSSSLRPGSRGSTSATSASSNPFRPQSRHTANTSIDLTPAHFKEANSSHDSLLYGSLSEARKPSFAFSVNSMHRNPSPPPAISVQRASESGGFNIDDYISSDEDLDSPCVPARKDEEHLLFNDSGFGMAGFELPGISGLFAPTRRLPESPQKSGGGLGRHRDNLDSTGFNDTHLGSMKSSFAELRVESRPHHRFQFHMPTQEFGLGEDRGWMSSEEEDSEEEISFDIPMTRMDSTLRQYRTSRYANREKEVIKEEEKGKDNENESEKENGKETETEKLDVKTLMRMRKAANKAKRLSANSIATVRSRSAKGKEKEILSTQAVGSAGFEADIE